jgi:hypothetical protein
MPHDAPEKTGKIKIYLTAFVPVYCFSSIIELAFAYLVLPKPKGFLYANAGAERIKKEMISVY